MSEANDATYRLFQVAHLGVPWTEACLVALSADFAPQLICMRLWRLHTSRSYTVGRVASRRDLVAATASQLWPCPDLTSCKLRNWSLHLAAYLPRRRLLLCGDVHPNPGPWRVVQWNCNSWSNMSAASIPTTPRPDVILLQEIRCQSVKLAGYRCAACPRNHRGGGVATLLRDDLQCDGYTVETKIHQQPDMFECVQTDIINTNGDVALAVFNVYATPSSELDVSALPVPGDVPTLYAGDFNAHQHEWSSIADARGEQLQDWADDNFLIVHNDPQQRTRPSPAVHRQNPTSPDLTMSKHCLILKWHCTVSHDSDHAVVTFDIVDVDDVPPEKARKRTYWSWPKADWKGYEQDVSSQLRLLRLPKTTNQIYKVIRKSHPQRS